MKDFLKNLIIHLEVKEKTILKEKWVGVNVKIY